MAWALVTGASSGIGQAVAIALSKTYSVVLGGRDMARLEETRALCGASSQVICWPYDISHSDDIESALQQFLHDHAVTIEAFVHCAGYSKLVPVKMSSLNDLETTFKTNVYAPFLVVKQLMVRKVNQGALKSVVLISSNISGRGSKAFSVYGSSKHAVDGLMRSLAVELAPKVRVNSIQPGAIKTRMTESIFANDEVVSRLMDSCPLGMGNPANIADAVLFLLSDNASWITGQSLAVDGGAAVNITA